MSIDDNDLEGMDWIKAELEDALAEDYELEISEPALFLELRKIDKRKHPPDPGSRHAISAHCSPCRRS